MGIPAPDRPLAGLVSAAAEALYARLLDAGWLPIGTGPGEIDPHAPATGELLEARLAYSPTVSGRGDRLMPVAHASALKLLLARQHTAIAEQHKRANAGWDLLDSVLSASIGSGDSSPPAEEPLVEIISSQESVAKLSWELYQSTRRELIGLTHGQFTTPVQQGTAVTPPAPALDRGVRFRMIYDSQFGAGNAGAHLMEESVASGEEARIRAELPLKMLHVDDRVALVAFTTTGVDGSLLIRAPRLLAALRSWFELLWDDAGTTTVGPDTAHPLSAAQRKVLRLLATGLSDEAIARASSTSVRTVRRHISSILELLGVNSRFAAGAAAAKRGWI